MCHIVWKFSTNSKKMKEKESDVIGQLPNSLEQVSGAAGALRLHFKMWLSVPRPSPVLPMPETSRSFPLVLCYLQYQLSCPSQEGNRKVIKNSIDYHLFTLLACLSQRQNTLNHLGSFPFLLFLNIIKLCSFFFLNLVGCKSLKKMLLNY